MIERVHASGTEIKPCTCEHAYQDEKYGKRKRVYNRRIKDGKNVGSRCTVCSKSLDW
jgi:hypothetical protein